MKTHRLTILALAVFGLGLFSTAGCAENGKMAPAPSPAGGNGVGTMPADSLPAPAGRDAIGASFASAQWTDISDYGYDRREQFFTGLGRLENKVAGQIAELTAKRATLSGSAHTQDWDFAMREMESARSYLHAMGLELGQGSPESWAQRKERVGQAWTRTQDAYAKVISSTTI